MTWIHLAFFPSIKLISIAATVRQLDKVAKKRKIRKNNQKMFDTVWHTAEKIRTKFWMQNNFNTRYTISFVFFLSIFSFAIFILFFRFRFPAFFAYICHVDRCRRLHRLARAKRKLTRQKAEINLNFVAWEFNRFINLFTCHYFCSMFAVVLQHIRVFFAELMIVCILASIKITLKSWNDYKNSRSL